MRVRPVRSVPLMSTWWRHRGSAATVLSTLPTTHLLYLWHISGYWLQEMSTPQVAALVVARRKQYLDDWSDVTRPWWRLGWPSDPDNRLVVRAREHVLEGRHHDCHDCTASRAGANSPTPDRPGHAPAGADRPAGRAGAAARDTAAALGRLDSHPMTPVSGRIPPPGPHGTWSTVVGGCG